jgi:hypothetical protein
MFNKIIKKNKKYVKQHHVEVNSPVGLIFNNILLSPGTASKRNGKDPRPYKTRVQKISW